MTKPATTKMSSRGQVVIPEEIRKQLHLEAGTKFVVVADKDVVILKTISAPSMRDFDSIISKTRKQAKNAGMKRVDISKAISQRAGANR